MTESWHKYRMWAGLSIFVLGLGVFFWGQAAAALELPVCESYVNAVGRCTWPVRLVLIGVGICALGLTLIIVDLARRSRTRQRRSNGVWRS